MGFWDDLWDVLTFSPAKATGEAMLGAADALEAQNTSTTHAIKPMIIGPTAVILGGVAAAPFVYRAYSRSRRGKRAKQAQELALAVDDASNRAVTLLAALLPAIGLPVAYLGIQELEARGVISKGLGDSVQTLIAAGAVAPAIGAVTSVAAKVT